MRLLVLCERVDSEGGTETYLRVLVPALQARGYEVLVVARTVGNSGCYGAADREVAWSDEHDPSSERAVARFDEIASAFAPQITAAHNVMDAGILQAARRHGGRMIYHLHDHRPFCPNGDRLYPRTQEPCSSRMGAAACGWHSLVDGCAYGPRPRTFGLIRLRESLAAAVRSCDAVIALSDFMTRIARDNATQRVGAIAPPLPDEAFATIPYPRASRDAVLFAGRIVPSKGGRSLVRAIAAIPRERRPILRVAGDGPDLQATISLARALDVETQALGRLNAAELRAAIDRAAVVAVPSLWAEPFGLAGIEAFARGRPVAAYDSGAISEWLVPDAGALVTRGDENALAGAIEYVLQNDVWNRMSSSALAQAQRYRLDPIVAAIDAVYRAA